MQVLAMERLFIFYRVDFYVDFYVDTSNPPPRVL